VGQAQHLLFIFLSLFQYAPLPASPKKLRAEVKQAGKKEGVKKTHCVFLTGEMNFCPLANTAPKARSGWEAAAHSAPAEGQSRKFFFSF